MSLYCTRRIEFDAAHRVKDHESKCKLLHGHRYVVEATFSAEQLDSLGRIIDFGTVKEILSEWINTNWDHNTILFEEDKPLGDSITAITGQTVYYLPTNPTAENMAHYLLHFICPTLFADHGAECVAIRLYETPNCYADASKKQP